MPIEGFSETGVVDMLPSLLEDWGRWQKSGISPTTRTYGIPRELGYITTSSPPIVVDGVIIVGKLRRDGLHPDRGSRTCLGDIQGFDARTGEHLLEVPRHSRGPGEFGHDTWESDAWQWTGDISSWAPISADYERGVVYIPTNPGDDRLLRGLPPGSEPLRDEHDCDRRSQLVSESGTSRPCITTSGTMTPHTSRSSRTW